MTQQIQDAGLYLHIPFCVHRCSYCDFFKTTDHDMGQQSAFLQSLLTELQLLKDRGPQSTMTTLYLGGGTPSLLEPDFMARLTGVLKESFDWSGDAEWTLEANPETVNAEDLVFLNRLGFNRISFGVQSFNPEEIQLLERLHTPGRAQRVVRWAREADFKHVSVDLMTALPGQTWTQVRPSLEAALALPVDHLSVYQLELHPGTPLHQRRQELPSLEEEDAEQENIFIRTSDLLQDRGYRHYEISNFAKPGGESLHNLRYWQRRPVWAAGPSAHGFDGTVQYANPAAMIPWQDALHDRRLPWKWQKQVDGEQAQKDRWVFGLRLADGLPKGDMPPAFESLADDLVSSGWVAEDDGRVFFTPAGWVRSNDILARLLPEDS